MNLELGKSFYFYHRNISTVIYFAIPFDKGVAVMWQDGSNGEYGIDNANECHVYYAWEETQQYIDDGIWVVTEADWFKEPASFAE